MTINGIQSFNFQLYEIIIDSFLILAKGIPKKKKKKNAWMLL